MTAQDFDREDVVIRNWEEGDIPALADCQLKVYAELARTRPLEERTLNMQRQAFPEGQLLAECHGRVIGYAAALIVQLDDDSPWHSYTEITADGTFNTHDPQGDTLYGAEIAVHPDYRGRGVAGMLYTARKDVLRRYNLRRMVAGGRIPGFRKYAGRMTAEQYVARVVAGELKDPALNAHLKAGYAVKGVLYDYLGDAASLNYATHLEMENPDYHAERRRIAATPISRPVRRVRVCAAQYELRRISGWEEFERQVDFFVSTAEEYHCHFLVFPEMFTAQLMSLFDPNLEPLEAVKRLQETTDRYLKLLTGFAQRFGGYIIGGSHPVEVDGEIRNVAHLFSPGGNVYTQEKQHVTPAERDYWGMSPGTGLRVFETEYARIAILICYDIEFPEISRLLTDAGAEIIFVPYMTDEKKAYHRVRTCAQARAVENYIYTVISGCVGNLPQVKSFLINYGQAAAFTPSDFPFPPNAIAAEGEANTETVVVTDLDLGTLAYAREVGSVRPLRERRLDLYEIVAKEPVQVIRTR